MAADSRRGKSCISGSERRRERSLARPALLCRDLQADVSISDTVPSSQPDATLDRRRRSLPSQASADDMRNDPSHRRLGVGPCCLEKFSQEPPRASGRWLESWSLLSGKQRSRRSAPVLLGHTHDTPCEPPETAVPQRCAKTPRRAVHLPRKHCNGTAAKPRRFRRSAAPPWHVQWWHLAVGCAGCALANDARPCPREQRRWPA